MRFQTDDPDIRKFLSKYDSIPVGDREHLSWEAIAVAAKVDLRHLLGAIQVAVQNYSANAVKLIAVSNHQRVTRARVKFALLATGERDRTALDTAMGILPSAKGPTFIGKAVFTGSGQAKQKSEDGDEAENAKPVVTAFTPEDDINQLFPEVDAMQERLVPIRQKLLTD